MTKEKGQHPKIPEHSTLPPRHVLNGVQMHSQSVNDSRQIPTLEKIARIAPPNRTAEKSARTIMIRHRVDRGSGDHVHDLRGPGIHHKDKDHR